MTLFSSNFKDKLKSYKDGIIWRHVVFAVVYHSIGLQAVYYILTFQVKWATLLWTFIVLQCSIVGITAGVHRLWSHRSYKAKLPLKILLCFFYMMAYQGSIYKWSRNHRIHHKYADTDADPHNIERGFFFAHIGWLLVKKHPDVIAKRKTIDFSDLETDPVVVFQHKYTFLIGFPLKYMPAVVPWYFWNENWYTSFAVVGVLRFLMGLHAAFMINSVAHTWGYKPYDKSIRATDNKFVARFTAGEAWHNYHHSFPWDYKASELGTYSTNITTAFIDFMAKIGWAYDLKTASDTVIQEKLSKNAAM